MRQPPNVLLITTDQQRAEALGCYGNPAVYTPHLDSLAERGLRFENCICQAPVCTPSRSCWITGQYISTHGVWANGVPLQDSPMLMPRLLQQAGYGTAMIGKLHVTPCMAPSQPQDGDYGFDLIRLTEGEQPGGYRHWLRQTAPGEYDKLRHSFPPQRPGDVYEPDEVLPEELHPTRWVGDQALDAWQRRVQHKPFFMHVSFPDPHHPFQVPKRFAEQVSQDALPERIPPPEDWDSLPVHFGRYYHGQDPLIPQRLCDFDEDLWRRIRTYYYGMVNFIDEEIGRILQAVAASGEETLVIFTSDHGELLGDHGLLYKGLFHYDTLLRVPLIVAGEGVEHRAQVVGTPVQEIDLMPTALATCGVTVPYGCQGQILPGVGRPVTDAPYDFTLSEQRGPWYTPELRAVTLRSNEWKLTLYSPDQKGELYHLAEDPQERQNLWEDSDYREIRNELTRQLARRLMDSASPGGRRTFRA